MKNPRLSPVRNLVVLTALYAASGTVTALAADANAGASKAASCAACHGANGISPSPTWPNLAGQKALYLSNQLKAFRDGKRNDPVMSPMAKPLSDKDIDDISAYYASLK